MGIGVANDAPFEFLNENRVITEINQSDEAKKNQIYNQLYNICPFATKEDTNLQNKIQKNESSNAASLAPDGPNKDCEAVISDMQNASIDLANMTRYLQEEEMGLSPQEQNTSQLKYQRILQANKSLAIVYQKQCDPKNAKALNTRHQQVLTLVDTVTAAAAVFNPVIGVAGALISAGANTTRGLFGWFNRKKNKNPVDVIKGSETFLNDLCTFRELSYSYDNVTTAVKEISLATQPPPTEEIASNKEARIAQLKAEKDSLNINLNSMSGMIACTQNVQNNINQLQIFADQLAKFTKNSASQEDCFNILKNYKASKKTSPLSPIDNLANRYHCSNPEELIEANRNISFCNNYQSIENMLEGDFVTKCEDAAFQQTVTLKFKSLALIIAESNQFDTTANASATAKVKTIEGQLAQNQQELQSLLNPAVTAVAVQAALTSLDSINRTENSNYSKKIENIGRNLLGNRFDLYATRSLEEADRDITQGKKVLAKLVQKKEKLLGKNNKLDKTTESQRICDSAAQVEALFIRGYKAGAGVKDICDFTKGRGIPPLKSRRENFDSYSASAENFDNNLSSRCGQIDTRVANHVSTINQQMSVMDRLGCVR